MIENYDTEQSEMAERIADFIQLKYNINADKGFKELLFLLYDLNISPFDSSFEYWMNYSSLIKEISYVLSDPAVSSRLHEFHQQNAYKMLRKVSYFFEKLASDEHLQHFLLAYNLKAYKYHISEDELEFLKEEFLHDFS